MLSLCLALSMHIGLDHREWSNVHPCIKYEHEAISVGAYLNSYGDPSIYASYTFGDLVWLEAGAVTGYPQGDVLPFLRAGYDVFDNTSVFVSPIPTKWDGLTWVVGVEFDF